MWINSELFRTEAKHFLKYGRYCDDPPGTSAYMDYWTTQLKYCEEGYSVGGKRITGNHYGYLNFAQIKLTEDPVTEKVTKKKKRSSSKIITFPDFWDGDYEYFWTLDIAKDGIDPEEYKKLGLTVNILKLDGGYHLILIKARRKGFEQPHSEPIMTPSGKSTMGDIKPGDLVLTPTGTAKVIEKFPQGKKEVFEVTLRDGRKVRCGKDHLWKIYTFKGDSKVVTTEYLLNSRLKQNNYFRFFIPNIEPVQYSKKDFPVDPYVLGVLLGDGSLTQKTVLFSTNDFEIVEELKKRTGMEIVKTKAKYQYRINGVGRRNKLYQACEQLGINTPSIIKRIPEMYKYGSIEQRMELVQGLMDTDGTSSSNGSVRFISSSETLVDDFLHILYSLGIRSKKAKVTGKGFSKRDYFVVSITTDKPVFKLKRKLKNIRTDRAYNFNNIPIIDVKSLGYEEESSCILIDSRDHLYLTTDFVTTHNSYKNGWVAANTYNTKRGSTVILGAFEKKYLYPKGTMTMASNYLNFLNEHTAWAKKRQVVDRQDHKKASFLKDINGQTVEKGYMSEILALTFQDNPDAARGKDADRIFLEECGVFDNLKASFKATEPSVTDGSLVTGQMVLFGTGGDMEGGGTVDFESMFYNPEPWNLLPVENIWDEGANGTSCGYFFPQYLNLKGFYDQHGNSDIEGAKKHELEMRQHIKDTSKDPSAIDGYIIERPFNPAEAFMQTSSNIFPVAALNEHRNLLIRDRSLSNVGVAGKLYDTKEGVKFRPSSSVRPITKFPHDKNEDSSGAVVIYQSPFSDGTNGVPSGLYFIAHDPYALDTDGKKLSLAATYVIKRVNNISRPDDMIVASYVGRPDSQDTYNENLFLLAKYYNAKIGFENDRGEVVPYAKRFGLTSWLMEEPELFDKTTGFRLKKLGRKYGISISSSERKGQGIIYLRDWLKTLRTKDEDGKEILNLHQIFELPLLEELIKYNPKGNFDRVSAMIVAMYYMKSLANEEIIEDDEPEESFFDRDFF